MRSTPIIVTSCCALGLLGFAAHPIASQTAAPLVPQDTLNSKVTATPIAPGSQRFNIKTEPMTIAEFVVELARLAGKKVIISEEVRARTQRLAFEFRDVTPREMMELLARAPDAPAAISFGTLDEDTWIVTQLAENKTPLTPVEANRWRITPREGGRFDIEANRALIAPLLEDLAKRAGKMILISDPVRAGKRLVSFSLKDQTAAQILNYLGRLGGFNWESAGPEIWLIVSQDKTPSPVARQLPDFNAYRTPRLNPDKQSPPGGQAFDFNGQTFYYVPITPDKAETTK